MAIKTKDFDRYVVYHVSGSPAGGYAYAAEIDCFLGTARAGAIYFTDSGPLPAPALTVNGIYLYMPMRRFEEVIATMRYEKPLYLALNTTSSVGWLGTSDEPVGEQEGV
jgi:hypothetical protein